MKNPMFLLWEAMKIPPVTLRLCPAFVFAVLALVCAPVRHALAGERTVYRGTLEGAGEVVMELGEHYAYAGRYFYPRYGVDIPLRGTLDGLVEPTPWMELPPDYEIPENTAQEESMFAFDKPGAIWKGSIHDGVFQGEWEDAKNGRKRAFRLERVAKYDLVCLDSGQQIIEIFSSDIGDCTSYDAPIDMKRTPYEYLKMAGHAIPIGKVIGNEVVAYQMWRDPRSKFEYPRLARHPDTKILEKINFLLDQRYWRTTLSTFGCQALGLYSFGFHSYVDGHDIELSYLSPTLMSVIESGSSYCGGAHPNNYWEPYTFDLLRGEYLDWNRLFHAFIKDKRGLRIRKPSPEMLKFITYLAKSNRYYVRQKLPPELGDEPPELLGSSPEDEEDPFRDNASLYFTEPDKLTFFFPGDGRCCSVMNGPYYSVPFSALKKHFLKPEAAKYLFPERE